MNFREWEYRDEVEQTEDSTAPIKNEGEVGGRVLFQSRQGWYFDVEGTDVRHLTSVRWEGAELDVPDFIEQLSQGEVEDLDRLLRRSWADMREEERYRASKSRRATKNTTSRKKGA